jgi:lipoprotein-anchoring transpeptidase ErfK/SrfK
VILRRAVVALVLLAVSGCAHAVTHQAALPAPALRPVAPAPVVPAVEPVQRKPAVPTGCRRTTVACVSTKHRVAWLQRDGRVTYGPVRVSLGGPGHRTPTGSFRVAWKDEEHTSSTYGIDMPWSVFFAHGGIAFHQGPVDEQSHGCVHLSPAAAERFFAELDPGDRVQVL